MSGNDRKVDLKRVHAKRQDGYNLKNTRTIFLSFLRLNNCSFSIL